MLDLRKTNVQELCRSCGMKSANMSTVNANIEKLLHKMKVWWNDTTNVQDDDLDTKTKQFELPQNLCFTCISTIEAFDEFCRRAKENTDKFHSWFQRVETITTKTIKEFEDDVHKLFLNEPLMETESVILECSLATTNVGANCDPFGIDIAADVLKTEHSSSCGNAEVTFEQFESKHLVKRKYKGDTKRSKPLRNVLESKLSKRKKNVESKNMHTNNTLSTSCKGKELNSGKVKSKPSSKDTTKNNLKCTQCNRCFTHKLNLDAHVRKVHEGSKRPFKCDRCDKEYTFIGGLHTHIKEIHETATRSYSCDFPSCDRVYISYIAMKKHKRTKHSDYFEKKFICEICGATFTQNNNLKCHIRKQHSPNAQVEKKKDSEVYECTICRKTFYSRYTLKYHIMQQHSEDMKYECNVCGRRVAKKFMLIQHMRIHTSEKIPCEQCGKQFIRKCELESHRRAVHMKLKPFECKYCHESFACRKTLIHHQYIHTGEKPYVCDICGQAYRQQTCLKNHRKIHEKKLSSANFQTATATEPIYQECKKLSANGESVYIEINT